MNSIGIRGAAVQHMPIVEGFSRLHIANGSLDLRAILPQTDERNMKATMRDLLECNFDEFKDSLLRESRREIRGCLAGTLEQSFTSALEELALRHKLSTSRLTRDEQMGQCIEQEAEDTGSHCGEFLQLVLDGPLAQ